MHTGSDARVTAVNTHTSRSYIQSAANILLGVSWYKMLVTGNLENKKQTEKKRRNHLESHHPEKTMVNIFALFSLRPFIL